MMNSLETWVGVACLFATVIIGILALSTERSDMEAKKRRGKSNAEI